MASSGVSTRSIRESAPNAFRAVKRGLLLAGSVACLIIPGAHAGAEDIASTAASDQQLSSRIAAARSVPFGALRVGDKLKVVFYERLGSDEEKWGGPLAQQGMTPKGFYQRPELTGEYLVGGDGTISLPLLGRFPVSGMLPRAVEASIVHSYEILVAKKGFVNILSIEHQPIYISGPVRTPGRYDYAPGMTVLHAVALSGGIQGADVQPWQKVEVERQIERLKTGLGEVKRLVARTDVLTAEQSGQKPGSIEIAGLMSNDEAQRLLRDEQWQRNLVNVSQAAQQDSLEKAVENARADLELRQTRVGTYDENIEHRRARLDGVMSLAKNKLIGSAELARVQSELTDAEDRKQQALIDVEDAKQRLAVAGRELEKHKVESRIEIEKATYEAERGKAAAVEAAEGDLNVFQSLIPNFGLTSSGEGPSFEIVRQGENGIVVEKATEETVLEPGDLVRVR